MPQTPLSQLISARLGRDIADYVVDQRNAGRSWREIAEDIGRRTKVRITGETVRAWFSDRLETVVLVRLRQNTAAPPAEPERRSA